VKIKVGFGYDVHALAQGESLVLGGVSIPHVKGTVAHSDGDVLIHALCDALLGAAALRDIGFHFPDTDVKFKGADSVALLQEVVFLIKNKGFQVGNVDATIAAQQPKINPFIPEMQKLLAGVLELDLDDVSLKASTTERLGFEGREEGISVYAVALIEKL
jgi:2-C-methyl-D-erythritol 2,4-cyclodiphosphate synthase